MTTAPVPRGGFGFLILYFVVSGIRFDLSGLLDSAMLRVPLFLATRPGGPPWVWH